MVDKNIWEKGLLAYPESNFLQSWAWGEFHQRLGHSVYREIDKDWMFQSIVEPARRARYLTVPGGPLIHSWNLAVLTPIVSELKRIAKNERCSFIRIRPQVLDSPSNRYPLTAAGFRPAPMHLHAEVTRIIDLTKPDEQLLSEMRKSTRYEIRRGQKLGIKVKQSKDEKLIDRLVQLQEETVRREHFVPFSKNYLLEQFHAFKQNNAVQLFYVLEKDEILSIAFVIFYRNEAVYHYAASSDEARKIPAAYAIQWAIIQEAKKRGCTTYNLWGDVPDDKLSAGWRTHRFAGPSLFKRGFGGTQILYLPAHDLPLSRSYWLSWVVETMRKTFRNL